MYGARAGTGCDGQPVSAVDRVVTDIHRVDAVRRHNEPLVQRLSADVRLATGAHDSDVDRLYDRSHRLQSLHSHLSSVPRRAAVFALRCPHKGEPRVG